MGEGDRKYGDATQQAQEALARGVALALASVGGPEARAAVAVGADGLLVEVHHQPEKALSDGPQSLTFEKFADMMATLKPFIAAAGRTL